MTREALAIGINRYPNLRKSLEEAPPHLTTPAKDAEAIARLLEDRGGFRVKRLPEAYTPQKRSQVDPEAVVNLSELEKAIANLFNPSDSEPPDTALLFFAGHGKRILTVGGVPEGYLVTSDASLDAENPKYGLRLSWLRQLLKNSSVRQQIVWLDCCHSGELLNFADTDLIEQADLKDRCLIAASHPAELAYEEWGGQHGILSGALIQALQPNQNFEGWATNYTIVNFIDRQLKTSLQRPIHRNYGGAILLAGSEEKIHRAILNNKICPYKGLEPFEFNESDPKYFFGREDLVDRLIQKVSRENFIAVVGASGSGKSSVVKAGLLYQLKLGQKLSGSKDWVIRIFRPGYSPLENLARALAESNEERFIKQLETRLQNARKLIEQGANGLKSLVQIVAKDKRLVLVIDQFEEAFTLCQNERERQQFFACLLGAVEISKNQLCVIITLRADFFGKCLEREYAGLARKIEVNSVAIAPMNQNELTAAITEPARQVGLEVERELVKKIIEDVEGPGVLPLLQYALRELWRKRDGNYLTLAEYTRLGGVKGTLTKQANRIYQELLAEGKEKIAKKIFIDLTQLGEGTEDTRRQVLKSTLVTTPAQEEVLNRLVNARLVVTSEYRQRADDNLTVTMVDVAHEALIRHWEQLRKWLNESRAAVRQQRSIEEDAREWKEKKGKSEDSGLLLRSTKLDAAEEYLKEYGDWEAANSLVRQFIQASQKYRDRLRLEEKERQAEEEERRQRLAQFQEEARLAAEQRAAEQAKATEEQAKANKKLRRRAVYSGIASVLAIVTAGTSIYLWQSAKRQAVTAELSETATKIDNLLTIQPVEALVDAIDATGRSLSELNWVTIPVESSLLQAVQADIREQNRLSSSGWVTAISPDGSRIITGNQEGKLQLWDRQGRAIGQPFQGHENSINSVAFSPDGKYIASGSADTTVRLWNLQGRAIGQPFQGHHRAVTSIAFSPDGKYIASGSWDKTVRLSNIQGRATGQPFRGHEDSINSVAFSPDGKYIASGSADNTVRLWDRQGRKIGQPFQGHKQPIMSIAFSPDGKYIASGGADTTVRLSNIQGRAVGQPFQGHTQAVYSVAFSPDGKYIASGGADNTVRLWDRQGQAIGQPFQGHTNFVNSVVFSPDGKYILSASADDTVRLWDLQAKAIEQPFRGHTNAIYSVTFSPDGKYIASGGADSEVRLWDLQGRAIRQPFRGHTSYIYSVTFSPDGQYIASGGADNVVRLWDLQGQAIRQPFQGHTNYVNSVAFSPDSKMIVSGSGDRTLRLWNLEGQEIEQPVAAHTNFILAVAFSPDGKYIVSGSHDNTIRLWTRQGQAIGQPFRRHTNFVRSVAFSPDSKMIVSASWDNTVRLWDLQGRPIGAPFQGHTNYVNSVDFSPDGKYIVSAGSDKVVRLWDLKGQLISIFKGHTNDVYSVAFSPDGRYITSGGADNIVRLWDRELKVEQLLKMACNQLREHPLLIGDSAGDTCLRRGDWSNIEKQEFQARREALAAQK